MRSPLFCRMLGVALIAGNVSAVIAQQDAAPSQETEATTPVLGDFRWTTGPPVLHPAPAGGEDWHSVKDPTIVWHDGKWHLFVTVRGTNRSHAIVYLSFADWKDANGAERHVLSCHEGYFCAPQVFYFTPHKKWYLICQAASESWEPDYQPAFATTTDIADPDSWSALTPLYGYKPENLKGWIDFWVICDDEKAHLFYTSNDGHMWRSETPIGEFPKGWSEPVLVLDADVFEASHTYKLKGSEKYLTLIEAEHGHGWRYYKAYLADRLDGDWQPLAATKDDAFASTKNVEQPAGRWTDAISHGELLRTGVDERLEVDPANLRFLFQGVLDEDRQGKAYGDIPWKLGLLEPAAAGEARLNGLPVEMTVGQRSTTAVPGSADALRLTIGDITRGQVMASLARKEGKNLIGPLSFKPGDSSRFKYDGLEYVLKLTKLSNALVGDDFATFTISEPPSDDTQTAKLTEDEKIERLIESVEKMEGAVFLRNGEEHSANAAAAHLRRKRQARAERITTAEQFIEEAATRSSVTGEAYQVRLPDGSTIAAEDLLRERLREIERGAGGNEAAD